MNEAQAMLILQNELDKHNNKDDISNAYTIAIKALQSIISGDAIVCGRDYWTDYYIFYHCIWRTEDNNFNRESFRIQRRKND